MTLHSENGQLVTLPFLFMIQHDMFSIQHCKCPLLLQKEFLPHLVFFLPLQPTQQFAIPGILDITFIPPTVHSDMFAWFVGQTIKVIMQ